jgi:hypothetical protein
MMLAFFFDANDESFQTANLPLMGFDGERFLLGNDRFLFSSMPSSTLKVRLA